MAALRSVIFAKSIVKVLMGMVNNMAAAIELTKAVIDGMVDRRFGRIVNITSSSVKMPLAGLDLSNGARVVQRPRRRTIFSAEGLQPADISRVLREPLTSAIPECGWWWAQSPANSSQT